MIELNCLEKTVIKVMKQGHVPQHIAFIMDGNRRYAKNINKQTLSGHQFGAQTLKKCLLYCLQLGVKYASFYAFSIQNFKRTDEQVDFLMGLARTQFQQLSSISQQENILQVITQNEIKVVVAGDLNGKLKQMYPDICQSFAKLEEKTKNYTKMTFYLCFAYDSIFEINQAIQKASIVDIANQTKAEIEQRVHRNLFIPHDVDLLIRTSGESRLSNFMLMQSKNALIEIQKHFWPSFNLLMLSKMLLRYNYFYSAINSRKHSINIKNE